MCRLNLQMAGPIMSEDQAAELDRQELVGNIRDNCKRGLSRAHVHKPCVRLAGPMVNFIPAAEVEGSYHPMGRGHRWMN